MAHLSSILDKVHYQEMIRKHNTIIKVAGDESIMKYINKILMLILVSDMVLLLQIYIYLLIALPFNSKLN